MAAVWPYATIKSVVEAGVKPEGVNPATRAAAEAKGIKVLETMMNEYRSDIGITKEVVPARQ